MATQTTSELLRAIASSVFLPSVVGGGDAFISALSDIIVLRVEANNTTRNSNQSCLVDAWEHPLSPGRRGTNLVSWGYDTAHLRMLIGFPTAQAAEEFRRAIRAIIFQWLAEQDDDMLERLENYLESFGEF
ncbi:hypothetical protein LXA43DRAFT_1065397 [Ganoderma leucocontextum]|nr:hypothetical protein LXA43DRAFT_1065397 [Ganoderma leucocontextum]